MRVAANIGNAPLSLTTIIHGPENLGSEGDLRRFISGYEDIASHQMGGGVHVEALKNPRNPRSNCFSQDEP